jgi:hypothetical protein
MARKQAAGNWPMTAGPGRDMVPADTWTRSLPSLLFKARLAIAALAVAGCGQRQVPPAATAPAPAPRPPAPAPAPAPAAPSYTLIITWLAPGEPPSTTQTAFHDAASCGRARDGALAEGQRLAADAAAAFTAATAKFEATEHRFIGAAPIGVAAPPPVMAPVPKVIAFCAGS